MQIAIVLFDRFTALDAVGPYETLGRLPDAETVFVAEQAGPVRTDTGNLALTADRALADVPAPDIVVVPGGPGQTPQMENAALLDWLRAADATSTWTTSVCTGSLLLAAAGLLKGRRATSHWLALDVLGRFGAEPTGERVVADGKYVTAAGVSSGIDMGLTLLGRIAGDDHARAVQLLTEYDPQPPYDAGSPEKAPAHLVEGVPRPEPVHPDVGALPGTLQPKLGCRRSRKAATPSARSPLPRASAVQYASRSVRPPANSFAAACVSCEREARTRVNSATRAPSSPSGSTSSTRPVRSARAASISSPENSRYLAVARSRSTHQPPGRGRRVHHPQLRRGHPEQRRLLGEPQVARGRQLRPAAHAVPAHGRQRRLGEGGQRLLGAHGEPLRLWRRLPQGGDVRPGAEGAALTGEHQRTHRRVAGQRVEQRRQRPPHPLRHRVALGRVADDDGGDRVGDPVRQLGLHGPDAIRRPLRSVRVVRAGQERSLN